MTDRKDKEMNIRVIEVELVEGNAYRPPHWFVKGELDGVEWITTSTDASEFQISAHPKAGVLWPWAGGWTFDQQKAIASAASAAIKSK